MNFNKELIVQLNNYQKRYAEITELLGYDEVLADDKLAVRLEKEKKLLSPIIEALNDIKEFENQLEFFKKQEDNESIELQFDILQNLEKTKAKLLSSISNLSIVYQKIIIEVLNQQTMSKKLFNFLCGQYVAACKNQGLNLIRLQEDENFLKIKVEGQNAFDLFKNENGIHKHKSNTVFVVAYPTGEMEQASFEDNDLKIDIYRSNGAGGQNVNKVSTAVRITHLKTGIVCSCQDERSQIQNKQRALENLKEKVTQKITQDFAKKMGAERKKHIVKTIIRNYDFDKNLIIDNILKQEFVITDDIISTILNLNKIRG